MLEVDMDEEDTQRRSTESEQSREDCCIIVQFLGVAMALGVFVLIMLLSPYIFA